MKNKNIIKGIFSILFILVISLNRIIFAIDLNETNTINIEENAGDYRIYSKIGIDKYIYYDGRLQTNYEYYYLDKSGNEMPAYCLELGVDGAETKDEYYVNVSESVNDYKLNSIILNGYPYKSVSELGVENVTEAKYATQFAIWTYLSNLDINKITPTSANYNRVVNAIKQIYITGLDFSYNDNNLVKIENTKVDVDNVDNNYFSTTISLEYNENVLDINMNLNGIEEYKITDELNNEISNLSGVSKFKILIPRDNILEDSKVDIVIGYNTLQTAIMFGKAKVPNMQNLALVLEPITFKKSYTSFDIEYVPVNFRLIKCDKEKNDIRLENVKFKIYNMIDEFLGEYTTDENGEINFDILKQLRIKNGQKVKIQEVETLDSYYINTNEASKIVEINYDRENIVVFENEKAKGRIKIIKTSGDYNEYNEHVTGTFLKDAIFEIYDEKKKLVQEIITNEYGEALSNNLLKGKYYIKEKKAPEHYILDDNIYEIEIKEHNEIITLNLKNSSQKKIELPKTGY